MIDRKDSHLETSVYRKKINNNIYMNWNSHSPRSWKIGTLRNLVQRAIMISSEVNLQKEIDHLQKVFCEVNGYPEKFTKKIISEEVRKHRSPTIQQVCSEEFEEPGRIQLNLPYAGEKESRIKKFISSRSDLYNT